MRIFKCLSFLLIFFSFIVAGCHTVQPKKDQTKQNTLSESERVLPESEFVMGKTKKEEVIAKWGKPNGVSINEKGEEILTFNRSHITGKAFIPFYYGRDSYRRVIKTAKFNKKGVLIGITRTNEHY